MTKISVAESTEEALEKCHVKSHKFLIPYREMALMHVIDPASKWIIVAWLVWSILLVEFWLVDGLLPLPSIVTTYEVS